ncbi:MAG: OmpA family protein [Betaproteobacteria bacterium]|nr:OmpA family protein [Betaproteobacteria bacterium]
MKIRTLLWLAIASSLALLAACSSTPAKPPAPPPEVVEPPAPPPPPPPVAVVPEPETPAPAPRQVAEKVTMAADVLFDLNRALIKPEGKSKLDELAAQAKAMDLEVVLGIGHTDRLGPHRYNQKLSVRRAEAVKRYLVERGVDASRIHTEGRAEKQPVKECTEKKRKPLVECLAPNRRVDIEIVGTRTN